jgi:hypothetical protein
MTVNNPFEYDLVLGLAEAGILRRVNVGGSKMFNCVDTDCPYKKMDRDEHGARNIAISTMSRMRRQDVYKSVS